MHTKEIPILGIFKNLSLIFEISPMTQKLLRGRQLYKFALMKF